MLIILSSRLFDPINYSPHRTCHYNSAVKIVVMWAAENEKGECVRRGVMATVTILVFI